MRAVLFTIDLIVAISVMLLAVEGLLILQRSASINSPIYLELNSEAQDLHVFLQKTEISEVADLHPISDYILEGSIGPDDFNKTLLDTAVSFYLNGNSSKAASVIRPFLLFSRYYRIDFDNQTILSNSTNPSISVAAGAMLSGERLEGLARGFVSRAYSGQNSTDFGEVFASADAAETDAAARFGGPASFETLRVSGQRPTWEKRITVVVGT